jgi:cell division protein FtsN
VKHLQRGSVIVGIIIGVVLGLAAALAVAVYVTKVPVPFLNKGGGRTPEQDAAESRKNQNWDPNAPLYGKNPAKPQRAEGAAPPDAVASAPAKGEKDKDRATADKDKEKDKDRDKATAAAPATAPAANLPAIGPASVPKPAVAAKPPPADPLGELAAARAAPGGDPFLYFVQAGAFRSAEEAETQRAKLSLMGFEARVTEREQSGRQVFRVRVGPFDRKDDADRQKEKMEAGGVETALVRVQR